MGWAWMTTKVNGGFKRRVFSQQFYCSFYELLTFMTMYNNISIIKMKYDYWRHPHLFIRMDGFGRSHTAEGSKVCPGGVGRTGMVGQAEIEDDHSVKKSNIYAASSNLSC